MPVKCTVLCDLPFKGTIRDPYTYQGLSNHTTIQADLIWCEGTFIFKKRLHLKICVLYAIYVFIKAHPTIPLSGRSNLVRRSLNDNELQ
jgi:hypothetical protein